MSLTEMLDNLPTLEEGMVPIFKWWEWTAIPLRKYFYDISVFLWIKRIEHLFQSGTWVNVHKDKNGIKLAANLTHLDSRYLIKQDAGGNIYQNWKRIKLPQSEIIYQSKQPETIGKKPDKSQVELEERVAELEKMVIKLNNQLQSKD